MGKWHEVTGKWEKMGWRNQKLACCKCGLVHIIDTRVVLGKRKPRLEQRWRLVGEK